MRPGESDLVFDARTETPAITTWLSEQASSLICQEQSRILLRTVSFNHISSTDLLINFICIRVARTIVLVRTGELANWIGRSVYTKHTSVRYVYYVQDDRQTVRSLDPDGGFVATHPVYGRRSNSCLGWKPQAHSFGRWVVTNRYRYLPMTTVFSLS